MRIRAVNVIATVARAFVANGLTRAASSAAVITSAAVLIWAATPAAGSATSSVAVTSAPAVARSTSFEAELLSLQQSWANAAYASPSTDARRRSLAALSEQAAAFSNSYPDRSEPLIWEAIVLSTFAAASGRGLSALKLARRARSRLERALEIDPEAMHGAAYTSLGALYYKVPTPPFGFGSRRLAGEYLRRGITANPAGIDANFFYGEYLLEIGDHSAALGFLQKALAAPPRPGRELADQGRRRQAETLIQRIRATDGPTRE